MTQQQIQQIFQLRYNQSNWKQFLSQAFLNARLLSTPEILTGINVNVATQALRLGYIVLNENGIERNIAVYDVTLAAGIILERNRVGLRNLLRKYWKDIDAAFIVYHRPENPNWRFTYVSELTGYDSKGELIKVKTEPKRFTYILGEGESCRTAAERFAIITKKGSNTTLDDVKDAFSVEKLSKSFFDEYKKHYELFCDYMVAKPSIRQTIFNGDEKAIRDFNKKLLGRIVFLYFIQKKGWMGVPEKSNWGQGDHDFLWNLFSNCRNKGIFYSEYLSKLFFDTLNTKRTNDIIELIPGEKIRIPFLNGGLFEEDKKKYRNLVFPADLFENFFKFFNQYNFTIYEDDPNDHTVAVDPEMLGHIFENLLEDNKDKGAYYTPKEIVHYMCQESLIEYLCTCLKIEDEAKEKEAVTILLKTKEIDDILKPEIQNINDALDKVKICDPAIGSGAFPMGLLKEIFTAKQTLYTFEHGNTQGFNASEVKLNIIQNSIYGVDIEKGAVDIARLRFWLSLVVDEDVPKALPNLDYKIVVGNSLVSKLGDDIIDIDWDIDYGQNKNESFVKQLKYYLNALSNKQKEFFDAPDKKMLNNDIRNLKIDILINQVTFSRKVYSNKNVLANDMGFGLKPTEIKKNTEISLTLINYNKTIEKLTKLKTQPELRLNFFDWKLDFPEVMNEQITDNVGFDIVIANPPYIGEKDNSTLFKKYKNCAKLKSILKKRTNIYYAFLLESIKLINNVGNICLIVPNEFLTSDYAIQTRKLITEKSNINFILNFNKNSVFKGVGTNSMIVYYGTKIKHSFLYRLYENSDVNNDNILLCSYKDKNISQNYLKNNIYWRFTQNESFKNKIKTVNIDYYGLTSQVGIQTGCNKAIGKLYNKIITNYPIYLLSKGLGIYVLNVGVDIKIDNESFFINNSIDYKHPKWKELNTVEKSFVKPIFAGNQIHKYYLEEPKSYVIWLNKANYSKEIMKRIPSIKTHLDNYKIFLINRNALDFISIEKFENTVNKRVLYNGDGDTIATLGNGNFYLLQKYAYGLDFEYLKLLWQSRGKTNFFLSEEAHYGLSSINYLFFIDHPVLFKDTSKRNILLFISGILNSRLYQSKYKGNNNTGTKIKNIDVIKINLLEPKQKESFYLISKKVGDILSAKSEGEDNTALEQQIDNMVYKLYKHTYEEVKVIDPEFSLTEQEYEAIKV